MAVWYLDLSMLKASPTVCLRIAKRISKYNPKVTALPRGIFAYQFDIEGYDHNEAIMFWIYKNEGRLVISNHRKAKYFRDFEDRRSKEEILLSLKDKKL